MFTEGNLNRYAKDHPRRCVCIVQQLGGGGLICAYNTDTQTIGDTIAAYARCRDCRRALRRLGYVQEGRAWRIVPKQAQPASPVATEVIEGEGF